MRPLYAHLARVAITLAGVALFFLLRSDVTGRVREDVTASMRRHRSPALISEYLKSAKVPKLQIGAGTQDKSGWLNTDIEPRDGQAFLDASERFPLPDRSFRYVFSEHVIEHLKYDQGVTMMKESFRVLAPGGRVRLATPDLRKVVALLDGDTSPARKQYLARKLEFHDYPKTPFPEVYILNMEMRDFGHQFLYHEELLRATMEAAGFRDVRRFSPGESDDAHLRGAEARSTWGAADVNAYESMVLEATRP